MAKNRLQLYVSAQTEAYIEQLSQQRKAENHPDTTTSAVATELLELGCQVHKMQQEQLQNNDTDQEEKFDLKAYCKDLMMFTIASSAAALASAKISDRMASGEFGQEEADQHIFESARAISRQDKEVMLKKHFSVKTGTGNSA